MLYTDMMSRVALAIALVGACAHEAPIASTTPVTQEKLAAPIEGHRAEAVENVAAHCAARTAEASVPEFSICDPKDRPIASTFQRRGPYRDARVFWEGDSETLPGNQQCELAVQTAAGWFVAKLSDGCFTVGKYSAHTDVDELAVEDVVPGGTPELVLRYRVITNEPVDRDDGRHGRVETEHAYLVVCGVDAGNVPSCIEPLELSGHSDGDFGKSTWDLDDEIRRDGKLSIKLRNGSVEVPPEARALVGVHELQLIEPE
jgi:hypothetical protein